MAKQTPNCNIEYLVNPTVKHYILNELLNKMRNCEKVVEALSNGNYGYLEEV